MKTQSVEQKANRAFDTPREALVWAVSAFAAAVFFAWLASTRHGWSIWLLCALSYCAFLFATFAAMQTRYRALRVTGKVGAAMVLGATAIVAGTIVWFMLGAHGRHEAGIGILVICGSIAFGYAIDWCAHVRQELDRLRREVEQLRNSQSWGKPYTDAVSSKEDQTRQDGDTFI